jgi:hypothetical protein
MSRRTVFALLVFAAIGVIVLGLSQHAPLAAQAPQPGPLSGLKGKLLLVEMRPNGKMVFVRDPSTSALGDHAFLVGTNTMVQDLTRDHLGMGEREIWLPIGDIQSVIVFDNAAQIEGPRVKPAKKPTPDKP